MCHVVHITPLTVCAHSPQSGPTENTGIATSRLRFLLLCVRVFVFLFFFLVLRRAASRFVFAVAAVAAAAVATCERWEIRAHVDQIGRQAYCSQRRRGFLGLEFSVHLACCEEGEPRPRMSARKFARRVAL